MPSSPSLLRAFLEPVSLLLPHVCAKTLQLCPTLCNPMGCSLLGSSVHATLQAENTGVGCLLPPPGDPPDAGIESRLPCFLHWQAGSLALAPPEKLAFRRAARQLVLRPLLPFLPVSMACALKATSQVKVS